MFSITRVRPLYQRSAAGLLLTSGIVAAAVMSTPARAADTANGHAIVMNGTQSGAPPCSACHGENGAGQPAAGIPRLAGLNTVYMLQQLTSFTDGTRQSPVMEPFAKALSQTQRQAVADYYASLAIPAATDAGTKPASDAIATGAELATRGAWNKGVPGCSQCHGPQGSGVGSLVPRLAGQSAAYITSQLEAWQSGARHNDPLGLMAGIAKKLDKAEIAGVAAYYAALPKAAAAAPAAAASQHAATTPPGPASAGQIFTPPPDNAIPDNEFGKMVRLGESVFYDTQKHAKEYVGNKLQCANCHLDRGRLAGSAPLWAAYVAYPAYRSKNKHVNTYAERMQGCFRFSMNGKVPAYDSKVLVALQAYSYFLAKGAPVGADMKGRGYPKLKKPAQPLDYARGEKVYAQNCALCHGADGQGQASAAGEPVFPPLWGAHSYNWGAGMGNISNAAAFIAANMPFSRGHTLSEQEAWDVAAFVDSHERPQDPRFTGSVPETRKKYHNSAMWKYGKTVNGVLLGEHSPPSGPQ